jgi:hypothetical protein
MTALLGQCPNLPNVSWLLVSHENLRRSGFGILCLVTGCIGWLSTASAIFFGNPLAIWRLPNGGNSQAKQEHYSFHSDKLYIAE